MDIASAASLAVYSFASSITPGPNNLMLATAGSRVGFRRTWPHMLGITAGCVAMFVLAGVGLDALFRDHAWLRTALRIFGAGYLLYLAGRLWTTSRLAPAEAWRPLGFMGAAGFQFLNPKAWIIVVPAIAAFAEPGVEPAAEIALICLVFAAVNMPCIALWTAMGAGARRLLDRPARLLLFNRVMAALTALTALLFLI